MASAIAAAPRTGKDAMLFPERTISATSLGSGLIRSVQHLRLPVTCYPSPHTSHNHPVELMSPPCIDHISHVHSHLRLVTATCMCSLPLVFGRLVCPGPTQHSPTLFAPIHFCFSCQPSRLGLRPAQFTRAPTCGFSQSRRETQGVRSGGSTCTEVVSLETTTQALDTGNLHRQLYARFP